MKHFEKVIERFKQALQTETIDQLPVALGLCNQDVSAVRTREVPASWYVAAYWKKGINPDWLQQGKGLMLSPDANLEKVKIFAELIQPLPPQWQDCVLDSVRHMVQACMKASKTSKEKNVY